jgi:dGTPase
MGSQAAKQRKSAAHGVSRGKAFQHTVTLERIRSHPTRLASLSPEAELERAQTKEFLYANLYYSPVLQPEKEAAERIITELFDLWMTHPEKLPHAYQEKAESEPLARVICDYIAGMTDPFISEQHEKYCR